MRSGIRVIFGSLLVLILAACEGGPARPARGPREGVRVVPASDVKGTCDDDDEASQWLPEDAPPRTSEGVTYVRLTDWRPPPQVVELEARIPPRGDEPPASTHFPKLTLDREIGETRFWRLRRR